MKFSMKRAALLAGVAEIGLANGAAAQDLTNSAYIGRITSDNFAFLSQKAGAAGGNQGFVYQYGQHNMFLPYVGGVPSDAQTGNNVLRVMQVGASNFVGDDFAQTGGSTGSIAQFGDQNIVNKFIQKGINRATIFQGG